MIRDVSHDGYTCNVLPWKFEAGTPPIAEAIGLAAAVHYLSDLTMETIAEHERSLTKYALDLLSERFGEDLTVYGPCDTDMRGGVLSLAYKGVHPHHLAQVLNESGVCVRAGHHCAKPLMRHLGVNATARASMYLYNDESDIDALTEALADAGSLFRS